MSMASLMLGLFGGFERLSERFFVFGVEFGEAICKNQGVATSFFLIAIRDEFATKEHSIATEGVLEGETEAP